jgi:energy-coupling factor transporter ATP-binding protein EcfA2
MGKDPLGGRDIRRAEPRTAAAKARIEEIRLQNFRAFDNVRLRIGDLTMLVGRNGAGKSSLLDAVEFMREAVTDSLPNALDRRGGLAGVRRRAADKAQGFGLAVVMRVALPGRAVRLLYGFRRSAEDDPQFEESLVVEGSPALGYRRVDQELVSGVPVKVAVPEGRLVLPLVAGEQLWQIALDTLAGMRAYEIAPQAVAAGAPIQSATTLARRGDNAGDVVEELLSRQPAFGAVLGTLRAVVPGLDSFIASPTHGRRQVVFQQKGDWFEAEHMSQGTLRALGILLALHQSPDSIHPRAIEAILEAAENKLDDFPVVITTHSPEVLAKRQALPERIRILQWDDGVSHLYPLSQGTVESVDPLTTVGDLLRFNGLWPAESPERFTGDLLELAE